MKNITPIKHQAPLPIDKIIIKSPASLSNGSAQPSTSAATGETVPMDVLFVGAGPAGLSGAIHLANLIRKDNESGGTLGDIQIGVLEKAANLGGHSLSGAVINPKSLYELFPDVPKSELPLRTPVHKEKVMLLTANGQVRIPTPPPMHNSGNFVASLCELVRYMGEKAEAAGINIFTSFPADSLISDGSSITGVRTAPAGLNRDGSPGGQYMPPTDITANVTVLTDGSRSPLAQAYCESQKIGSDHPQIYALGVKELWRVKKAPDYILHTLGYPLPRDVFGGSWLYPMADDLVSFGLVVGLDYAPYNLDTHMLLQKLKRHPLFKTILAGGEIVEWGAKTIPEGGWQSLPKRYHGDGILLAGDSAGFVNVPALKGIHYAIKSGMLAAETIFSALKKQDFSSQELKSYDDKVNSSYIRNELYPVRNMRQAFKSGFYLGGIKASLMTITGGLFPSATHSHEDAAEPKNINTTALETPLDPNAEPKILSKVDAVYLSGNKTRDDIPQHLTVGTDITPEVADMYAALCPAGVYERQGDKLVVNAPNCVDCKATDVLGPRWQPREGGAGPDYKTM